ncbi:hypothetical protein CDN95_28445 [Escherichia coli]|nr:hypothetical protein CDN95_28445 [Escherichia coli]
MFCGLSACRWLCMAITFSDIYLTQLQVQEFFSSHFFWFLYFFIVANNKHNILSIFIDNINGIKLLIFTIHI